MAFLGSKHSIVLGLAIVLFGYGFGGEITDAVGENLYYVIIVLGLALAAFGIFKQVTSGGEDADLSEEELRNKVILHTLARMTNADSNVMQVEVESVIETYESITGSKISSKDIRVAALGELFEEKPFCSYLSRSEKRISVESKKKIMKALSTIMQSDGVVDPQEVEFFNTVAKCLNMQAGDLVDIS